MNPIRIGLGILLATLISVPACSQGQSAPPATSASHPMRIRIPGTMQSPALNYVVQPEYPTDAKVTGAVVLHAVIANDGTVSKLDYVSGPPFLTNAAIEAVKQWRYRPTLLNGQPAEVDTTINVIFALDKKGNLKPQPRNH